MRRAETGFVFETVIVTKHHGMAAWQEKERDSGHAFFKLPPDSLVELGVQVEL